METTFLALFFLSPGDALAVRPNIAVCVKDPAVIAPTRLLSFNIFFTHKTVNEATAKTTKPTKTNLRAPYRSEFLLLSVLEGPLSFLNKTNIAGPLV